MLKGGHLPAFGQSKYIVHQPSQPNPDEFNCPPGWRVKNRITPQYLYKKVLGWLSEQHILMEAFLVAVTFHVLLFPLIWFVGWALPWPKPPIITTVIDINLENWPDHATPERIQEIYNYQWSHRNK